ncbi:MAG: hypothetical protein AB1656_09975, partial [Candidatus Omnitrophota bacterium]
FLHSFSYEFSHFTTNLIPGIGKERKQDSTRKTIDLLLKEIIKIMQRRKAENPSFYLTPEGERMEL